MAKPTIHRKQLDVRYIADLDRFAFTVDRRKPVWLMTRQEVLDLAESLNSIARPPPLRFDILHLSCHAAPNNLGMSAILLNACAHA
jgi:hypothetical protein